VQNRLRAWLQDRRRVQQGQVHEGEMEAHEKGRDGKDLRPDLLIR
jgi:hypothetical protein